MVELLGIVYFDYIPIILVPLEIWYVDWSLNRRTVRYLTFFNIIPRIPLPYEFGILISSSLVINHNLIWL